MRIERQGDVAVLRLESGKVEELIVATNPDIEGEATALYLTRLLKPMGIRVSRIAQGLPMGGDLEFAEAKNGLVGFTCGRRRVARCARDREPKFGIGRRRAQGQRTLEPAARRDFAEPKHLLRRIGPAGDARPLADARAAQQRVEIRGETGHAKFAARGGGQAGEQKAAEC